MDPLSSISEEIAQINGQVADIFRALSKGFQNLERIKDVNRQRRQLEELTGKMRECKRLIKEFDREVKDMVSRNDPDTNKMLNEKKQSMIKELNSYVALKKQYATNLENNKRVDLFDGPNEELHDNNMLLASSMTNQQIMDHGNQMMDETDQVVQDTVNVERETAVALKAQVATDKCIMGLLFLIVIGVIAIIIVKSNPLNGFIRKMPAQISLVSE
ncbi:plant SNARE [Salix suchowensis]|nr:plant SNARE [Salix suchowensis]